MNWKYHIPPFRRLIPALLLAVSVVMIAEPAAHAQTSDVQQLTKNRTKQDIAAKWHQFKPMMTGENYMSSEHIYNVQPKLTAPYVAGSIKPEYIQDGVNATNFVRYLAGLPDDLVPDWTLEAQEQTAALLNAVNDQLTHYPSQPTDMEQSLFKLGYAGTSSSNLFSGSPTFYDNVLGYMSDSDSSNIDRVGHRRWILNPKMKKTMFGQVSDKGTYSSMYAFNKERDASEVSYDYVAWPSAGYFPQEVFDTHDAWSVSLNPDKYDKHNINNIRVTLERKRDGKTWGFDQSNTDLDGNYFNVETTNYGIGFAVIFRPAGISSFSQDETFSVKINGLTDMSGNEAQVGFETTFFKLLSQPLARYDISLSKGETLKLGLTEGFAENYMISGDSSIVTVDHEGNIKAVGKGKTTVSVNDYLGSYNKINFSVTDDKPKESVSPWAVADYTKAKGNGIVSSSYDHSYQKPITREDFASLAVQMAETILDQYLYTEKVESEMLRFNDVSNWRVAWASLNGIINGTSAERFSPNASITREQAATLLLNLYSKLTELSNGTTVKVTTEQTTFADNGQIAGWAKENVQQAVGLSLMKGVGGNRFDPKGKLTYEQTFVLLQNAFDLISPH